VRRLGGRVFRCFAILIGGGFRAAIHSGHGRHGGLTSIAFPRNPFLFLPQLRIERAERVIEALIESRATFVGCLGAIDWDSRSAC
jgi:hypothetical protein